MFDVEVTKLTSTGTTRRKIVTTGAKLAYAAPLIAGTMKLSAQGVGAASPVGCQNIYACNVASNCGEDCWCVPTTEGGSWCHQARVCSNADECASSADCPAGTACVYTCCDTLICAALCSNPNTEGTGLEGGSGWSGPR